MRSVQERTKITRAPCRKRTGDAVSRAENFGDFIKADQKVLSEGCESRNNHRLAVGGARFNHSLVQRYPFMKPNLLKRRKGVYGSFSSCRRSRKSSFQTLHWNLRKPKKNYHGIKVLQSLIDLRRMVLLRQQYAELKNLCSILAAWMKSGGGFHGIVLLSAKCSRPPGM